MEYFDIKMEAEKIRLWTYQPLSIYKMVMEQGVAYCQEESVFSKYIPHAYRWMAEQMRQRIDAPEVDGVQFPLWAWQYYNGTEKPKPRRSFDMLENYEDEIVYMELLLPASRVLTSDFMLWHHVLGKWNIGGGEDDPLDEKTWELIFDSTFDDPDYCTREWNDRVLQATFWCLKKEDIVYADLLTKQEGKKALKSERLLLVSAKLS